jgi:glycosyltransferase involved in cell wall biosynthesis
VHWTALVESVDHVCCRYRLAAFRPFLERAGHTLELRPLPHDAWSRLTLANGLRGAAVILQRKLLSSWELDRLRQSASLLVFDFDDAVFLRDSYSPKGIHHPGRLRRFAAVVKACDAVVAGNDFLAAHAARWAGPDRVHVVPTCVDPTRYPATTPKTKRDETELVWVGSSSTLRGLEAVAPMLDQVGRQVPGLRLKLLCDRFLSLIHLPVLKKPWTADAEASEIAAADVGISWVPADDWSRGKCGLKVLQYMAAGLPVVANPVGVHCDMIRHGETGFLAATPEQWVEAVGRLAGDPELRTRMGRAGRELLESKYGVERGAAAWSALLDALRRGRARAG